MKTRSIFLDGRIVKARTALVNSLAPGVVGGKGVFETMRVYNGKIFVLEDHLNRLFRGLRRLGIQSPYSKKRWRQHLYRTVKANRLKEARVRLAVWKEGRRLRIAVVCQNVAKYSDRQYQRGLRAVVSTVRRKRTRFSDIKSLDYACFRNAFLEAQDRDCGEAVLLNNRKELVEGSRTNVFFVRKGTLYTPAVRCGCLNGITRQIVIRSARRMGIPCKAVAADVRALLRADEAFVTNSVLGVIPLTAVDGRLIGWGKAGPLTEKLLCAYYTNVHSACPPQRKSV